MRAETHHLMIPVGRAMMDRERNHRQLLTPMGQTRPLGAAARPGAKDALPRRSPFAEAQARPAAPLRDSVEIRKYLKDKLDARGVLLGLNSPRKRPRASKRGGKAILFCCEFYLYVIDSWRARFPTAGIGVEPFPLTFSDAN